MTALPSRIRLRSGLFAAGAAVIALAASACGSSSTPAASGSTSGSSTAAVTSAAAAGSAAASSAAGSSAAGSGAAASGTSKLLTDAKAGKLVVGIKFDQPGLGLKNPDGSFSGFDVEVAKYVANNLGVPESGIEFKESKSAEREGLIERGEVDYIVATYSITDTRKQKINFAGPYFVAHQDLLVKADNADITGPEAMAGKALCSVTGSTPARR